MHLPLSARTSSATSSAPLPRPVSQIELSNRRACRLEKIVPYNHNSSTFFFALPEGTQSGLSVASCLVVKSATEGQALAKNGKPTIRPYTPVTAPDVEGKIVRSCVAGDAGGS